MATDPSFPSVRRNALDAAHNVLRNTFGHEDFRGLQARVIGEILAARSALAVLPTGGGKSLVTRSLRWSGLASVWSSRP